MRSLPMLVIGSIVGVLLVVLVLQVGGLREDVAAARNAAEAAGVAADSTSSALDEVRAAVDALNDELAALPRSGVVPTDSSQLILERMTEIRDQVAGLAARVDDICRNAPIELC